MKKINSIVNKIYRFKYKKIRSIFAYCIILSTLAFSVIYALDKNIDLYVQPTDLMKNKNIINKNVRLGAVVKKGSIQKGDGLFLSFVATDFQNEIQVKYNGILPDLFREGQGIVVYGKYLENRVFYAKEILTKHDEKYMPPDLKK